MPSPSPSIELAVSTCIDREVAAKVTFSSATETWSNLLGTPPDLCSLQTIDNVLKDIFFVGTSFRTLADAKAISTWADVTVQESAARLIAQRRGGTIPLEAATFRFDGDWTWDHKVSDSARPCPTFRQAYERYISDLAAPREEE